jgi:hypothetical protein
VRVFDPATNTVLPDVILDLPVNASGQRGLKGITFATDGSQMFVTYERSTSAEDRFTEPEALEARLSAFPFAGGAVTGDEAVLWTTAPRDPAFPSDLNGVGPCVVAPDGFLYFSHGDRNSRFSTLEQNPDNPSGRIMRLNQDGSRPPENAPPDTPLFASGFRDVQTLAFDPATGLMFIADHGSGVSDELNLGERGIAYGWPFIQGLPNTDLEDAFAETFFFLYRNPLIDFGSGAFDPRGMVVLRNHPYGEAVEGDLLLGQTAVSPPLFGDPNEPRPNLVHRYRITGDLFIQHSVVFEVPVGGGKIRELVQAADGRVYVICTNEIFVLNPPAPAAPGRFGRPASAP